MDRRRLLVSWLGYADLRSLAAGVTGPDRAQLLDGVPPGAADKRGPFRTLLDAERFDEVHLLSNYPPAKNRLIKSTLGRGVHVRKVQLSDPTDYAAIFSLVDQELAEIAGGGDRSAKELCIHLSPGTPAMAAVWVLLGKTRYPATFFQTHGGRAWETEIPFDITADFLPELLRDPDAHLQHLAAQAPGEVEGCQDIIGDSKAIRIAVGRAKRAAVRDVPVLIYDAYKTAGKINQGAAAA